MESTPHSYYGSAIACLNLKYASMSSPIKPYKGEACHNRSLSMSHSKVTTPPSNSNRVGLLWPTVCPMELKKSNQVAPPHRNKV